MRGTSVVNESIPILPSPPHPPCAPPRPASTSGSVTPSVKKGKKKKGKKNPQSSGSSLLACAPSSEKAPCRSALENFGSQTFLFLPFPSSSDLTILELFFGSLLFHSILSDGLQSVSSFYLYRYYSPPPSQCPAKINLLLNASSSLPFLRMLEARSPMSRRSLSGLSLSSVSESPRERWFLVSEKKKKNSPSTVVPGHGIPKDSTFWCVTAVCMRMHNEAGDDFFSFSLHDRTIQKNNPSCIELSMI